MLVVDVWIVRVRVDEPRVLVPVSVRFTRGVARSVAVLMMRIVNVPMLVRDRLMFVLVLVPLC